MRGGTRLRKCHLLCFTSLLSLPDQGEDESEDAKEELSSKPQSPHEPVQSATEEPNPQISEPISEDVNGADHSRTEPMTNDESLDKLSKATEDGQETITMNARSAMKDLDGASTIKGTNDGRGRRESDGSNTKSPLSDDDDDDEDDDDDRDCRRRRRRREDAGGWVFSRIMPLFRKERLPLSEM